MPIDNDESLIELISRLMAADTPFPDSLGLFTDGPPHWTVSKGKKHERPSQTLAQATRQRNATASRLHWQGNHIGDANVLALESKLIACNRKRPCLSGACPICVRAQQRLLVIATTHVLPQLKRPAWERARAISLVPEFGRVAVGALRDFDVKRFQRRARAMLRKAGIGQYLLGLDVSLNHDQGKFDEAHWQFQWWGFFEEPRGSWRPRLKALASPTGAVSRPIRVVAPDSPEAAAAYGLKSQFKRRVSVVKANLDRTDRGECQDTTDRLLRGSAWVELMLFLDRIGIERRLLGLGLDIPFQPLRSRRTPESGGDQ